ncbi:MAG TPA: hypothetical protein PKJ75_05760, partial [Methanosarcina vacuolata]|nr:hypothetical protein [Methanosarcina vacuolata]
MGYGSRNIDKGASEPMVTIRGKGAVQRFSQFPDMPQAPRGGVEYLHQNPFPRATIVPEKRELTKGPSPTEGIKAKYAEMRRKMHEVIAEKSKPEALQSETPESQDDLINDRSQLQFFEPVTNAVRKPGVKNPKKRRIIEAEEAFRRSLEEGGLSVFAETIEEDIGNRISSEANIADPDWDTVVQTYT